MKKKILWKSEYRLFTAVLGGISLLVAIFLVMHLVHHETGEAFGTALVLAIPIALTIYFAIVPADVIQAMWRPETVQKAQGAAWEESFLNPANISPEKKDPPDIG